MMNNTTSVEKEVHTPEFFSLVKGKKELIDYLLKRGVEEETILSILSKVNDSRDLEAVISAIAAYTKSSKRKPNLFIASERMKM